MSALLHVFLIQIAHDISEGWIGQEENKNL